MFLRSLLFLGEGMFFGGGRRGVITIFPKERVKTPKNPRSMQKKPQVSTFTFRFRFLGVGGRGVVLQQLFIRKGTESSKVFIEWKKSHVCTLRFRIGPKFGTLVAHFRGGPQNSYLATSCPLVHSYDCPNTESISFLFWGWGQLQQNVTSPFFSAPFGGRGPTFWNFVGHITPQLLCLGNFLIYFIFFEI